MLLMRVAPAVGIALLLAGCGPLKPASVLEGECRIVHTSETVILGKTARDQEWIDDTTERLVGGCGQPRPKARRADWDAPKVAKAAPSPQKRGVIDRLRGR